ncbi:MAG: TIGR01777 family oxidoreductase, partial [Acidobacteriota bacterium]|nr:TIGR01777 family oxidoreductase [Acidobacteriota bacterium]
MKCIVSGGRGFIGRRVVDSLLRDRHYVAVWSREPGGETRTAVGAFFWDPLGAEPAEESLTDYDAVIHLAGEPVAQRWTAEVKQKIRDSRVLGTKRLVDALTKVRQRPKVLVCASAIGFYGSRGEEELREDSGPGAGFLADVCRDWEREADRAADLGMRVVKLRIGVVLGREGGALAAMLPAFRSFLGGRTGDGRQWMSWIHVD